MNTVIHKANQRGHADFGWLDSYHSFSFGNYYDPEKIHFGALRVLNDDVVIGGRGFGFHPVSYTHLRAHETVLDIVCRLLLEKKNKHK